MSTNPIRQLDIDLITKANRVLLLCDRCLRFSLNVLEKDIAKDTKSICEFVLDTMYSDDRIEIDSMWLGQTFNLAFTKRLGYGHEDGWCFHPQCGDLSSCVCYEGKVMIINVTRGQVRQLISLFNLFTKD